MVHNHGPQASESQIAFKVTNLVVELLEHPSHV